MWHNRLEIELHCVHVELAHDFFALAGFKVRDEDFRFELQFFQLVEEQRWTKVVRQLRKCGFAVAKRGFDDQVFEIPDLVDCLPKRIATCGVASKHQARMVAIQLKTDCWNSMIRGDRRNFPPVYIHRFSEPDFLMPQERIGLIRDHAEIRPDFPVKDVILEYLPGFASGMHRDVLFAHADDGIYQQGDTGNVVEMRMRHEDVVDSHHGFDGKIGDAGPRIDQDIVIHQDGSGAQIAADSSAATQYANLN